MSPSELVTPTRIVFGAGAASRLGQLASPLGRNALVVTGNHPQRHQSLIDELSDRGVAVTPYAMGHEPTVEDLRRGAEAARGSRCDLVVSIGGGSALDTGKVLSALIANAGDVLDYLEVVGKGEQLANAPVPHIAVPTTAGTGSEATKNAVLLSEQHGVKVSMRHPLMIPTIALVDPELTRSMPRSVTVSSGLDALTHLIESYVSLRANPLVDPFCEDGIRRAARSLRNAAVDGDDMEARADMSLAGLYGGLALANAGLGAVHGLVGVLGGRLHVPHGIACGCLLAAVFEANVAIARSSEDAVVSRFDRVARLLTGAAGAVAGDAVTWLADLAASLELPALGGYGLTPDLYGGICESALRSSSMKGNPVVLETRQLSEILAQVT